MHRDVSAPSPWHLGDGVPKKVGGPYKVKGLGLRGPPKGLGFRVKGLGLRLHREYVVYYLDTIFESLVLSAQ